MWGSVRNSSERGSGAFLSKLQKCNGYFGNVNGLQPFYRASTGFSWRHHHRWLSGNQLQNEPTSLFVDFLPFGISRVWIHGLFSGAGKVVDVYISKKQRKNNNLAFGFVRYQRREDAMAAIKLLHGSKIKNSEIKVSLARYSRDGSLFKSRNRIGPRFRLVKETSCRNNNAVSLKGSQKRSMVELSDMVFHAKSSTVDEEILEISKQPSVVQGSCYNPEPESVAVFHRDACAEESISNVNMNDNEEVGVDGKLPHPDGLEIEPSPAPSIIGLHSIPKLSSVADLETSTMQPTRSETTKICPTKKSKGKRAPLNSKEIADLLGFFTSGPTPTGKF